MFTLTKNYGRWRFSNSSVQSVHDYVDIFYSPKQVVMQEKSKFPSLLEKQYL